MSLRKLLLRLMLASLAFSALAGMIAVLLAGRDVVWRVVGTGMTAAVASGLLLVLSLLIDKEKSRPSGLLGMAAVIGAFILALLLIWDVSNFRGELPVGLSLLLLLAAAPPAMFFLRVMFAGGGRWSGVVGLSACATGFAAFVLAIWWENWGGGSSTVAENLMGSGWAVALFGALAAGSVAGLGTDRRWWRWIGVAAAAVAGAMVNVGIWKQLNQGTAAFTVVTGLAVIFAHANLAFMVSLKPGQRWLRAATISAVVISAVLIDVLAMGADVSRAGDLVARGAGAAAIAAGCGTLALLVLARLNRKISASEIPTSVTALTIICPWCGKKQALPLGESRCAGCGLRFRIAVDEPRCPNCDYLLYMQTSDRCPECGAQIATDKPNPAADLRADGPASPETNRDRPETARQV